jgi:hypothetical protein
MLTKHRLAVVLGLATVLGAVGEAQAAGTLITGQIGEILVLGAADGAQGVADFRVYLSGSPTICNGYTWAYVNASDYNYQAIVADILTARSAGATVSLYWIQQSNGFCEISYLSW